MYTYTLSVSYNSYYNYINQKTSKIALMQSCWIHIIWLIVTCKLEQKLNIVQHWVQILIITKFAIYPRKSIKIYFSTLWSRSYVYIEKEHLFLSFRLLSLLVLSLPLYFIPRSVNIGLKVLTFISLIAECSMLIFYSVCFSNSLAG